jgi:hypothetical protein
MQRIALLCTSLRFVVTLPSASTSSVSTTCDTVPLLKSLTVVSGFLLVNAKNTWPSACSSGPVTAAPSDSPNLARSGSSRSSTGSVDRLVDPTCITMCG